VAIRSPDSQVLDKQSEVVND